MQISKYMDLKEQKEQANCYGNTYSWKKFAIGVFRAVIVRPGFSTLTIKGSTSGQG